MDQIDRAAFERAIGKLCIAWGIAERGLDICLSIIYDLKGGDGLAKKPPRGGAKDKIEFFRKATGALPGLRHVSKRAAEIACEAEASLDFRNWCIHGVAEQFSRDIMPSPVKLVRSQKTDLRNSETKEVTLEAIQQASLACARLALKFALFTHKPLGVLPLEEIERQIERLTEMQLAENANEEAESLARRTTLEDFSE